MLIRALAVWIVLLLLAILNGAVRESLIRPRTGELLGHALSTLILCAAIVVVSVYSIGWIGPESRYDALAIGGVWLVLTLAFEFLGGHFLFGNSWTTLLADYNVLRGRVWILVLLTTLCAPIAAFVFRARP